MPAVCADPAFVDAATRICGGPIVDLASGGSDLRALRFADASLDAAYLIDALEQVLPAHLDAVIAEAGRVVRRYLCVEIHRNPAAPLGSARREEWDRRFLAHGWSKHPRYQELTAYDDLERESRTLLLAYERLPADARQRFPLEYLAAERDLHMDMLREAGRRSDAHVARYTLAAESVRPGDAVLDAACGLGYGSALLHDVAANVTVTGIDISDSAIDYARATFASRRPALTFTAADVMRIASYPSASFNVIASFETLEHIPNPDAFVAEAARLLRPGGKFICSVPNQWLDETGRDPNPFHLSVFDLDALTRLLEPHLRVDRIVAQFAGGGMKHPTAARRFVPVPPGDPDDAEWWMAIASKPADGDRTTPPETTPNASDALTAECRRYEREYHRLREQQASFGDTMALLARQRDRLVARALAGSKGIVIFGAGEGGRRVAARWRERGGHITALTDNRAALWGQTAHGLPVIAPGSLPSCDTALIVIASSVGYADIKLQLETLGLCDGIDFIDAGDLAALS
jgi:ubiquinone/menaquinone biosynthesis C-methylase UbiE